MLGEFVMGWIVVAPDDKFELDMLVTFLYDMFVLVVVKLAISELAMFELKDAVPLMIVVAVWLR